MTQMIKTSARKLPTVLGGGILGVAVAGLGVGLAGLSLGLSGEALFAVAGMIFAGRYA